MSVPCAPLGKTKYEPTVKAVHTERVFFCVCVSPHCLMFSGHFSTMSLLCNGPKGYS